MLRTHITTCLLIAAAVAGTNVYAAQRTHVSAAIGVDTNTVSGCSPVAPCRTFQAAMTVTDPNGEVVVLDSGGYGGVTINQSVALIAPTGVYAGISVFAGGNGITIGTPGVNVVLRGLTINGQGGRDGIVMTAGNKLTIENCVISNLAGNGISVNGPITVRVTDTVVRDNRLLGILLLNGARGTITRATVGGNGGGGILTQGSIANTLTTADVADSTIRQNLGIGVSSVSNNVTAVVKVSVRNSHALRNATGLGAFSSVAGGVVSLSASGNTVAGNSYGIAAIGASANAWASDNLISDNSIGFLNQGASLKSARNNVVRNNDSATNTVGTITPVATR